MTLLIPLPHPICLSEDTHHPAVHNKARFLLVRIPLIPFQSYKNPLYNAFIYFNALI